jgi:putative MFS transporter
MTGSANSLDAALGRIGTGRFQARLLGIFGLVWAADAMQVLAIGFAAPTLAASFGIAVPQAIQVGTAFFLGMMLGAWGFGRLADRVGRRAVLIGTVLADAVFGLASALAPDFTSLLVLRFLTGAAVGGTLPVDYAAMAEFLPAARRGRWLVLLEAFWALGTLALALASWAAAAWGGPDGWRWIFAATALPALVGVALRFWVPESPYFLWRRGRLDEADRVLARMAAANGRSHQAGTLRRESEAGPRPRLLAPPLRRPFLLILTVWLLVSMAYYGLFVWLPAQLAASGLGFLHAQGFLVLVALAQLPGYALAAYGVERWGRRRTLIGFLLAAAAGCSLYVATRDPLVISGATLLMSFAMLGAWGALYAFTPELFPTAARATGMGAAGALARVGGLLAPSALGLVVAVSFAAAIGLFAVLLALAALAVAGIREETRGRVLD